MDVDIAFRMPTGILGHALQRGNGFEHVELIRFFQKLEGARGTAQLTENASQFSRNPLGRQRAEVDLPTQFDERSIDSSIEACTKPRDSQDPEWIRTESPYIDRSKQSGFEIRASMPGIDQAPRP
jgi:hypothetical protein